MKSVLIILGSVIIGVSGYFFISEKIRKSPEGEDRVTMVRREKSQDQYLMPEINGPQIAIDNFEFYPSSIVIDSGTSVRWVSKSLVPHIIESDHFRSEPINKGDYYNFTFEEEGVYQYNCGIHNYMRGEIIVK